MKDWGDNFQTPPEVCEYMASLLPDNAGRILEPTPGKGNLVAALEKKGTVITPRLDFNAMDNDRFDYIVMNPPFSPMKQGYDILYRCMEMSDNIVALMPYHTLMNSDRRHNDIKRFGLVSVTHLYRKTFKGAKVQTCILEMRKGYTGNTEYKTP